MVAALTSIFAMSQAYRTLPAIVANAIKAEFHLSAEAIGFFAGAFHLSFGLMQLFVGVALDRYGPKWTVCDFFSLAVLGGVLTATFLIVRDRPPRTDASTETLGSAFKQATLLFKAPQTAGILVLGAITYSSLLALRGLWIVPLFVQRHDFTLVQTGNVVLILS